MKDFYAILGVVPSAEDVVIRAAWKALVQRYHPDRVVGDVAKANARMAEINEAYSVLSDQVKRNAYDKLRGTKESNFGDWIHEDEADEAANSSDPLEKDWILAVSFYPDLAPINDQLSRISQLLAFNYRALLLESKAFNKRVELAELAEKSFLQLYFGTNQKIMDFAKALILEENKTAAKMLNDSIRVLGKDGDADSIINKICKDFKVETPEMRRHSYWTEANAKNIAKRQDADVPVNSPARSSSWLLWGTLSIMVLVAISIYKKKEDAAFIEKYTSIDMVAIPPGSFEMGSINGETNERPMHKVTIDYAFEMGKFEVTREQWKAVMGKAEVVDAQWDEILQNKPDYLAKCATGNNCPIDGVNWDDAKAFISKLNIMTGKQYRLPTEAEWEYACRAGGRPEEYCGGDNLDSVGWYGALAKPVGNSGWALNPVGLKQANAFGLYDMTGNVSEWVEDSCQENYNGAPMDGSAWKVEHGCFMNEIGYLNYKGGITRGGSWADEPQKLRAAHRNLALINTMGSLREGFRLARTLP